MLIYTLINILIVVPPLMAIFVFQRTKYCGIYVKQKVLLEKAHIICSFVVLFWVSALRGAFTSDYDAYVKIFYDIKTLSITDILRLNYDYANVEIGFIALNMIVGQFADDSIWIFIVASIIILLPIYRGIIQYSQIMWISLLIFVVLGNYYPSFNIVRQIMAASIMFEGAKHLYQKDVAKYLLYVLLGSSFHITSLVLAAFSFLLIMRPTVRMVLCNMGIGAFIFIYLDFIVSFIDEKFFGGFYTMLGGYMGIGMTETPFINVVVPLTVGLFALCFRNVLDFDLIQHRVWFNGTIFWTIFMILTMKISFMIRIAAFFSPFVFLLVPAIIYRFKDPAIRLLFILMLAILLCAYSYYSYVDSGYDPYYTI